MKEVFIIVDVSGSIVADDTAPVGAVNDILRDLIDAFTARPTPKNLRVITYSDEASVYWQSGKTGFLDISESKFSGRSNLGKAYALIGGLVKAEGLDLKDCALLLISDGEATDNYKKQLSLLDGDGRAFRAALSMGKIHLTTEKHALKYENGFTRGCLDRDAFIDKAMEFLI